MQRGIWRSQISIFNTVKEALLTVPGFIIKPSGCLLDCTETHKPGRRVKWKALRVQTVPAETTPDHINCCCSNHLQIRGENSEHFKQTNFSKCPHTLCVFLSLQTLTLIIYKSLKTLPVSSTFPFTALTILPKVSTAAHS